VLVKAEESSEHISEVKVARNTPVIIELEIVVHVSSRQPESEVISFRPSVSE